MNSTFDTYKDIIVNEFFPAKSHGKLRMDIVKKLLSEYEKNSDDISSLIDLHLCLLENGVRFIEEYTDTSDECYDLLYESAEKVTTLIKTHHVRKHYSARIKKLADEAQKYCEGHGFGDDIADILLENI